MPGGVERGYIPVQPVRVRVAARVVRKKRVRRRGSLRRRVRKRPRIPAGRVRAKAMDLAVMELGLWLRA